MNGVKVETNSVTKNRPKTTEFLLKMVLEGPNPTTSTAVVLYGVALLLSR